jgi:hypothetical protein
VSSGGGASYNGVSYDPNKDYQAAINAATTQEERDALNKQRNAKIAAGNANGITYTNYDGSAVTQNSSGVSNAAGNQQYLAQNGGYGVGAVRSGGIASSSYNPATGNGTYTAGYSPNDYNGAPAVTGASGFNAWTPYGTHFDQTIYDASPQDTNSIAALQDQYETLHMMAQEARARGDTAAEQNFRQQMSDVHAQAENIRAGYGYSGGADGSDYIGMLGGEQRGGGSESGIMSEPYNQVLSYKPGANTGYVPGTKQFDPADWLPKEEEPVIPSDPTLITDPPLPTEEYASAQRKQDVSNYYDALLRTMASGRVSAADAPIMGLPAGTAYGNGDYSITDRNGDGRLTFADVTMGGDADAWSSFYGNPYEWTGAEDRDNLINDFYSDYLVDRIDNDGRNLPNTDYTPTQMTNYQNIVASLLENEDPLAVIANAENTLGQNIYRQLLGENLYEKMLAELQRVVGSH